MTAACGEVAQLVGRPVVKRVTRVRTPGVPLSVWKSVAPGVGKLFFQNEKTMDFRDFFHFGKSVKTARFFILKK